MAGFARKKYYRLAKGFYGKNKNCMKVMVPRVEKSLQKAYIGRKQRPRIFRRQWISSINAAVRDIGVTNYSRFTNQMALSGVILDRKILSDLAKNQPYSFKAVHDQVLSGFIANMAVEQQHSLVGETGIQVSEIEGKRIINQRGRFSIEEMVRRNMLTAAKLKKEDYESREKTHIKTRYER